MKKKFLIIISLFIILVVGAFGISFALNRNLTIDEILETKSYRYLSANVKEYIRNYYEETGVILLTEDNAKEGEAYLNPSFIDYLDSDKQEEYGVIPTDIIYLESNDKSIDTALKSSPTLPSKYDLRNVDGKTFVTPNKLQDASNCWAYAAASVLETHDLIVKNKSYDSSAITISAKQLDYARSTDGIIGGNTLRMIFGFYNSLGDGASFRTSSTLLVTYFGSATNDWDNANITKINNKEPLEPSVVYNRNNFLYEVDETREISTSTSEASRLGIKESIYNYGGMVIATCSNYIKNGSNLDEYIGVCNRVSSNHALHMIGWDDDYNYSYCKISTGDYSVVNNSGTCDSGEKVTGTGAWILKNSWGDSQSIIYLPYDSMGLYQAVAFVKYADSKNWDNFYELKTNDSFNETRVYTFDSQIDFTEKVEKLKVLSSSTTELPLYFSEDGSDNYDLIGNYSFDYYGYHTIDLSNMNLNVNKNSKFKFVGNNYLNVFLFTSNNTSDISAKTHDYVYSTLDAYSTNEKYLNMSIRTEIRGIGDNKKITYKIKKTNGEYLPVDAYSFTVNSSYSNLVTPIIKLKDTYAKKGSYILETYYNNNLISTSSITLNADFVSMKGSGSYQDPWQIENIYQFNTIRNSRFDNYILMNDLDFEYDTQNSNGVFYNSGEGWNAIEYFSGNLNGNGKTIRNLKTSSGLFNYVSSSIDSKCKNYECGIHDLNVDNIIYNKVSNDDWVDYLGGIMNYLSVGLGYNFNLKNLSVKNFQINNIVKTGIIGGIVGQLNATTTAKIDNWYSDVSLNVENYSIFPFGGVVGLLYTGDGNTYISFNNIKSNVVFKPTNMTANGDASVSDLFGRIDHRGGAHITLNNIISNFICSSESMNVFTPYAIVSDDYLLTSGDFVINGFKSTLNHKNNDLMEISNSDFGLKPYEFSKKDYSGLEYYESNYKVYNVQEQNTNKVTFSDKFILYDDYIPTLKKYIEDYSKYFKNFTIKVGETKSVEDLISKDTNYRRFKVYSNFMCDYDVCNNVTDETIISVPTESNNYTFTGLKTGNTKMIIYDELSGYLDTVTINVVNDDEFDLVHKLILDYNYESSVNEEIYVESGSAYGDLPVPERNGYTFLGWFTEKENGSEVNSTTIFNEDNDVTIYAHWQAYHVVTFSGYTADNIPDQIVIDSGYATKPSNPTRDG